MNIQVGGEKMSSEKNEKKTESKKKKKNSEDREEIQVFRMSWRWSFSKEWKDYSLEEFKKCQPSIQKLMKEECDTWTYQLECTKEGTSEENWHYQGCCQLKKRCRPVTQAIQWNTEMRGVELSAAKDYESLRKYCCKSDTRKAGPWAEKPLQKFDMQRGLSKLKFVKKKWQDKIWEVISADPADDERNVHWIYDPKGCGGKSMWAKMISKENDWPIIDPGEKKDMQCMLSNNRDRCTIIFDIPRTYQKKYWSDTYALIETVKNGGYMCGKYKSEFISQDPPHILVFSNERPDISKLSEDRWCLYRLDDKGDDMIVEMMHGKKV